ncbi:MAG: phage tail sheath family protein [Caldilineaceae bacterium]|nr:phage tail sheath family protein [Caldilineaceae bacterium]
MPEYLAPGVYVEEISGGAKPIEAVSTSTACFIGFTEKAAQPKVINGERPTEPVEGKPIMVTSWEEYVATFGGLVPGVYTPLSVYGFFQNGGKRCYILSVKSIPRASKMITSSDTKQHLRIRAKQAGPDGKLLKVKLEAPVIQQPAAQSGRQRNRPAEKAAEGGEGEKPKEPSPPLQSAFAESTEAAETSDMKFKILVHKQSEVTKKWKLEEERLVELKPQEEDGVTSWQVQYPQEPRLVDVIVEESSQGLSLSQIWPTPNQDLELMLDRQSMEPAPLDIYQGDAFKGTGILGSAQFDDINIICMPDLMLAWDAEQDGDKGWGRKYVKAIQTEAIAHCDNLRNRVVILDPPPYMNPQEVRNWRLNEAGYDSSRAALYYPWIEVMDPATNKPVQIPPSGHVAGIWARNDTQRGVHKAPANEIVGGAIDLGFKVTHNHQETLNPEGINCIRFFPGMGYRVWGARTLSKSDPEWRYLNVRRLFHMIEQSIQRNTMWAVFEPNDQRLWAKLRRDVGNFLMVLYSQGMLFGATAAQAFYVKCDETNNPKYTRDLGQVIVDIGIAPVKPAEFVIFRVRQWSPEEEQI